MKSRIYNLFIIVTLFIFSIILILLGIVPIEQRSLLLFIVSGLIVAIIFKEKWTFKKLGIRLDNFKKSFLPYIVFTIVASLGLWFLAGFLGRNTLKDPFQDPHLQYMFLIISFLQEFAYRGFLIPKLKEISKNPVFIISVNALLFSLIHLIFPDPIKLLPLGLASGIGFATIYYFYPNLILITLSHAILNYIAVLFCFFSINQSCR